MIFQYLPQALRDQADQLTMLALSGAGGAYFRAVLLPEKLWRRRIVQGVAGVMSALFLGGLVAYGINKVFDTGPFAWLACGFILGSAGEAGVKALQEKILGKPNA